MNVWLAATLAVGTGTGSAIFALVGAQSFDIRKPWTYLGAALAFLAGFTGALTILKDVMPT